MHYTQINLRLNKQLLITQQQAYQSFLSHFLLSFRLRHSGVIGVLGLMMPPIWVPGTRLARFVKGVTKH